MAKKQISLTFDDIKMIPYIVTYFDSIVPEVKDKKQTLKYTATIGDVTYTYVAAVSRVHSSNHRNLTLKTGWLTKQAKVGAVSSPQQSQGIAPSHILRTASITPLERYIKKNYSEEARKIALKSYESGNAMLAPNGKRSNLPAELYVAVRFQSFKNWFGDWENDPANASKAVDENGEPLVVYHGSLQWFHVFNDGNERHQSGAPDGTIFDTFSGLTSRTTFFIFLSESRSESRADGDSF